jgi:hypothetical protein
MPSVDPTLFDLHRTRVQALCDRVQAEISVRHDTDHLPVFFGFNHGHDAYIPVLHDTGRPRGCIKGQATVIFMAASMEDYTLAFHHASVVLVQI